MAFSKPKPSDDQRHLLPKGAGRRAKRTPGRFTLDTEARSLEEACDIIAERQRYQKRTEYQKTKPLTLRQKFGQAKTGARLKKIHGLISLAGGSNKPHPRFDPALKKPPRPHPFRDLPPKEKPAKMREMYQSRAWGHAPRASYHLGRLFGVPKEIALKWITKP